MDIYKTIKYEGSTFIYLSNVRACITMVTLKETVLKYLPTYVVEILAYN